MKLPNLGYLAMGQPLIEPDTTPPSARRNRGPILEALRHLLSERAVVLEIASGSGAHALHFAKEMPHLVWQPTDADATAVKAMLSWFTAANLPNLLAPLHLDVTAQHWPVTHADAIVAINMIHIAPWAATEGLFTGAGRLLKPGRILFLYGPFKEVDRETAPSNVAFDGSLKQRNPEWGLRNLAEVAARARDFGFEVVERLDMPANNLSIAFRRL